MKPQLLNTPFTLLLLMILMSNCHVVDCPEDGFYGVKDLAEESISKIPYINYEKVIFKNKEGKESRYQIIDGNWERGERYRPVSLGVICEQRATRTSINIESEYISVRLWPENNILENSLDLSLTLSIRNLNLEDPLDTLLVDEIWVRTVRSNDLSPDQQTIYSQLRIITSDRGNHIDSTIIDKVNFAPDLQLLDQTFTAVYSNEEHLRRVHYNAQQGIVGFEDAAKDLWVFDRFE